MHRSVAVGDLFRQANRIQDRFELFDRLEFYRSRPRITRMDAADESCSFWSIGKKDPIILREQLKEHAIVSHKAELLGLASFPIEDIEQRRRFKQRAAATE